MLKCTRDVFYVKMTHLETTALNEIFGTCSFQEKEPHCRTTRKCKVGQEAERIGGGRGVGVRHDPEPMLWFLQKEMSEAE